MKFAQLAALVAVASAHRLESRSNAVSRAEIEELQQTLEQLEELQQSKAQEDFDWGNLLNKGKTILHNILHKFWSLFVH